MGWQGAGGGLGLAVLGGKCDFLERNYIIGKKMRIFWKAVSILKGNENELERNVTG